MVRKIIITLAIVILLGVAYYAFSPIFTHTTIDEPVPAVGEVDLVPAVEEKPIVAPVIGTTGHPASGTARVIDAGGKAYVRYENFKTLNGPDLYVYLATDRTAHDHIDLGPLKATEGNSNYEIPHGTDLSVYHYVLVWCKTFSVLFNFADLAGE